MSTDTKLSASPLDQAVMRLRIMSDAQIDGYSADIRIVLSALAAQQERAELLAKDAERLEWLAENSIYTGGGSGGWYRWHTPADLESGQFRAEIDAAMAASGPSQEASK